MLQPPGNLPQLPLKETRAGDPAKAAPAGDWAPAPPDAHLLPSLPMPHQPTPTLPNGAPMPIEAAPPPTTTASPMTTLTHGVPPRDTEVQRHEF